MLTRRDCLVAAAPALGGLLIGVRFAAAASPAATEFAAEIAELERKSGGRLGVAVLDANNGARLGHRGDERFPMCSTHKLFTVAAVLKKVDHGTENLDRVVHFTKQDLIANSPVTETHVGGVGITVHELCEAAVTVSDNTAANLLLASIGGPMRWTAFMRSIGDEVSRLDRNEPTLNESLPGDRRDTASPNAIVSDLRALLLGDVLLPDSRDLLRGWMVQCKTGDHRLRAGLPADWKEGDKTGTGSRGTSNDIAIVWPPHRAVLLVAAFLTGSTLDDARRDEILAVAGKAIAAAQQS